MVYDYIMEAKRKENLAYSQRNRSQMIEKVMEKPISMDRLSTPSGYFLLGQNVSFDRTGNNSLKMQTFHMDIKEDENESQSSYVPKLQNSQIKRYFQGSSQKRRQSS